jgi:hypothetical protein
MAAELIIDNTYDKNYIILSKDTVQINISNNLPFKEYKTIILDQIINNGGPKHIVWNFVKLNSIPWQQLGLQASFMRRIDNVIWDKISKMTIVVKNKKSKIPFLVIKTLSFYDKNIPLNIIYNNVV